MKMNTEIHSDNKGTMNEIIRMLKHNFAHVEGLGTNDILFIIGAFLYLKKQGVNLLFVCDENGNIPDLEDYNKLQSSDPLYDVVGRILFWISDHIESYVFEHTLNFIELAEFSEDEYLYWFDYCVDSLSLTNGQAVARTPSPLLTLAEAFIGKSDASIYVPFSGIMNAATDIERFRYMESCTDNDTLWLIGMLRIGLSNRMDNVNLTDEKVEKWTDESFDAIVSLPYQDRKIKMDDAYAQNHGLDVEFSDLIAGSRFMDTTTSDGVCVLFMVRSCLWGGAGKMEFRKFAIQNGILDTIILLPDNMLAKTTISVACVVLRKHPRFTNSVRIIDATQMFNNDKNKNCLSVGQVMEAFHSDIKGKSATISYDSIIANEYSWAVYEYLNDTDAQVPEGYKASRLEEIVTMPDYIESVGHESGKIVKLSDLSVDWTNPFVDIDKLAKSRNLDGYSKITQEAVLVSTVRTLRASIVSATEDNPVWVDRHILAFIPTADIDPKYLCMVLAKSVIEPVGANVKFYTKASILNFRIVYPELAIQKSIYKDSRKDEFLSRAKEQGWIELLNEQKAEYINEVRSRKHDMMPHLRQLSSARKNLEFYLEHKDNIDAEELLSGMKEELNNQKSAIETLTTLLSIFSRESQFGDPEVINIDKFFMEHFSDGDNYDVDHETDYEALVECGFDIPDSLYSKTYVPKSLDQIFAETPGYAEGINVFMAKDDLLRLCDNIISNAAKHGFTDPERRDYNILTILSVDPERDMFVIDFRNNGNPLPEGLDKIRYGLRGEKAGLTGGTGEGGYVVKSIVEHYHGDYDVFCEEAGNCFVTTIRIYLPIYREDDEK